MPFLGSILGLAVPVGIIVIIVVAARRRAPGGVDAQSVRRFFQYVLLFALFVLLAIGLSELLGRAFGAEPGAYEDSGAQLAQALAFVFVAGPFAAVLSWWTWRRHRADPEETDSGLFVAYVTIAALVGLLVAAISLQSLIADALDGSFDAEGLGVVVAWGVVWGGHWWLARRTLDVTHGAPHLLLGSLVGLAMAAVGIVMALGTALDVLLRPGTTFGTTVEFTEGSSLLITGALVWTGYWLWGAARLPRNTWWLAFVLLVGVGGGLVAVLTAASQLLWRVLVWFVGDRAGADAATHFESATTQFATLVIGGLIWWYHRALLGERREERTEVRRVYEYLVAGIGLVAAATGVGTVLVAFIEAVTPGFDAGMTVRNTLLASLTALLVGVPVWWVTWTRIRRAVAADPDVEVPSMTRRIYLVVLFGIAGIAAIGALIAAAVIGFNDVVDAQLSGVTIRSMRYALGVVVATAAVSAYHAAIFRQDRARGVSAARGPRSIVLVGPVDADVARVLARATGARVEVWGRLDVATPPWDADALGTALAGMGGDLLVVADPGGWRVVEVDPSGRRAATPESPDSSVPALPLEGTVLPGVGTRDLPDRA